MLTLHRASKSKRRANVIIKKRVTERFLLRNKIDLLTNCARHNSLRQTQPDQPKVIDNWEKNEKITTKENQLEKRKTKFFSSSSFGTLFNQNKRI